MLPVVGDVDGELGKQYNNDSPGGDTNDVVANVHALTTAPPGGYPHYYHHTGVVRTQYTTWLYVALTLVRGRNHEREDGVCTPTSYKAI